VRLEGLGQLKKKKFSDLIGKQTRDLAICSLVPQPTTLPRASSVDIGHMSLTHAAEPFLRSCQLCRYSRNSQHFMEPGGSSPRSQDPSTGTYPKPARSHPTYLRSILILSIPLRLGLPSGFFIGHMETKLCKPVSTDVAGKKTELKRSPNENSVRKHESTPMCVEIPELP
jgi:hypothetical protein